MDTVNADYVVDELLAGKTGCMPTDTIFGLVAKAERADAIERIYKMKYRRSDKPLIILISDIDQLKLLHISVNEKQKSALHEVWPGPVSVIFKCASDEFSFLHRGLYSLAVRLPAEGWLRGVIDRTGPIIATSANISGQKTPDNIAEIKKQLPDLDFYIGGKTVGIPSRLAIISPDGIINYIDRS